MIFMDLICLWKLFLKRTTEKEMPDVATQRVRCGCGDPKMVPKGDVQYAEEKAHSDVDDVVAPEANSGDCDSGSPDDDSEEE